MMAMTLGVVTITLAAQSGAPQRIPRPTRRRPRSREARTSSRTVSRHDEDGRARSAAVAIAADLTDPEEVEFGEGDARLFGEHP